MGDGGLPIAGRRRRRALILLPVILIGMLLGLGAGAGPAAFGDCAALASDHFDAPSGGHGEPPAMHPGASLHCGPTLCSPWLACVADALPGSDAFDRWFTSEPRPLAGLGADPGEHPPRA